MPDAAGVLSALGLVASDARRDAVRSYVRPARGGRASCRTRARRAFATAGSRSSSRSIWAPSSRSGSTRAHEARYGYADRTRPVELVALRTATVEPGPATRADRPRRRARHSRPASYVELAGRHLLDRRRLGGRDRRLGHARPGARARDPRRAAGDRELAPRDRRGDGRGARPLGVLVEHQGAARLLDRALRPRRAHDRPGGAHPRPPRRDARGGRRRHGPRPCAARGLGAERPVHGRDASARHHARLVDELGFAVSRAHHADVGGIEPASLPAFSTVLSEEGLVIPPTRLDDDVVELIASGSRNPDERRGDLRAQLAAHRLAERRQRRARRVVAAASWSRGRWTSCTRTRSAGSGQASRRFPTAATRPRTSSRRSTATSDPRRGHRRPATRVEIDFTGTAPQHRGNLNCPLAVTRSACFFVVRVLTDRMCPPPAAPSSR